MVRRKTVEVSPLFFRLRSHEIFTRTAGPHADIFLWSVKKQVDTNESWILNDDYTLRYVWHSLLSALLLRVRSNELHHAQNHTKEMG